MKIARNGSKVASRSPLIFRDDGTAVPTAGLDWNTSRAGIGGDDRPAHVGPRRLKGQCRRTCNAPSHTHIIDNGIADQIQPADQRYQVLGKQRQIRESAGKRPQ